MKTSMIKRTILLLLVVVFVVAAYSPSAFCTSPSPSPTDSEAPTATPEGSPEPTDSTAPTETPSGFPIKLDSRGTNVIRVQMRLRDLGYFNYRPTGKYFNMTQKAVKDFQQSNGLDPDGRVGEMTYQKLFTTEGLVRKPLSPAIVPISGPQNDNPQSFGELGDWATINEAFAVGTTATVTDVNKPEITFSVTRAGGTNLAQIEATTSQDYTNYLKCFGGEVNWEKRSVIVAIGGVNYAASLFGNPSGADTISGNTMEGHTTLYFYGSTSDVSGFEDKEDLKMVLRAANKPIKFSWE
jgi:peptidoglycan hydrolase-like protein with peptidoglycan-binding domain